MADLAVLEVGPADRPTVALLHGVGTSGWMWRRLVEAYWKVDPAFPVVTA